MSKIYAKLFFLAVASLLLNGGCEPKHTPASDRNEVMIGETFQIHIKENPSTGYENCWINKKDALAVSLVKKEYKQEGSSNCAGCGGTATFTFKGIAAGTDTIKLVNCPGPKNNQSCDECSEQESEATKFIAVVK